MTGDRLEAELVVGRSDGFALELSFDLHPGRTYALLGPNGAGKSTAVAAIAGLLAIDAGRIRCGDDVFDDPTADRFVPAERRRIGVVFQDYLLFSNMSVAANVAFGPRCGGMGRRAAAARAAVWLDRLDLTSLADRRPGDLSGGQRQRVALARALAVEPRALLLDEPMAALDVATRTRLRRDLADHLAGFDGPRLLITHEPTDALILADEVLVIERGRLTQRGSPEEVRRRPATPYVAAVAGTNLLAGRADGGEVTVDGTPGSVIRCATRLDGPVQLAIHPRAVSLHTERPEGSPRNVWSTTIEAVEPLGDTTRIQLGSPLSLMADVTPGSVDALGLAPGVPVWASVKATEVDAIPLRFESGSESGNESGSDRTRLD